MDRSEAANRFLQGDETDPEVLAELFKDSDKAGRDYYLFFTCVRNSNALSDAPEIFKRIIKTESWKKWHWIGREFTSPTLSEYLTKNPPRGVGVPLPMVEKLIRDDLEALAMFREETTGKVGTNQHSNNVTTLAPERGNSRAYTLSRLMRQKPELYDKVVSGDMSANAAAKEAGWRKEPSGISLLRWAWKKSTEEERDTFRKEIS